MTTRRQFIASTSAAALAGTAGSFAAPNKDEIKLALVGCGGRGTGAANQNLNVDKGLKLVAMAVQEPTLTYRNPATKKPFTKAEFEAFAEDYLGADVIFWSTASPWLKQ